LNLKIRSRFQKIRANCRLRLRSTLQKTRCQKNRHWSQSHCLNWNQNRSPTPMARHWSHPSCRRSLKHFQNLRWSRQTNRPNRRHSLNQNCPQKIPRLNQTRPIHLNHHRYRLTQSHRSRFRHWNPQNRSHCPLIQTLPSHPNLMRQTLPPMSHRCHYLRRLMSHRLNRSRQTFRWNRLPILNYYCCKT
jgi:hypothetical protein